MFNSGRIGTDCGLEFRKQLLVGREFFFSGVVQRNGVDKYVAYLLFGLEL
jgi:hypothetical protein